MCTACAGERHGHPSIHPSIHRPSSGIFSLLLGGVGGGNYLAFLFFAVVVVVVSIIYKLYTFIGQGELQRFSKKKFDQDRPTVAARVTRVIVTSHVLLDTTNPSSLCGVRQGEKCVCDCSFCCVGIAFQICVVDWKV